jgi:hypothetical protein
VNFIQKGILTAAAAILRWEIAKRFPRVITFIEGSFMGKIWAFLDGKKTAIGGAVLAVFGILQQFGVTLPVDAQTVVNVIGEIFVVVGLFHKGVKGVAGK